MSEESAWAQVDKLSDEVERLRRSVRRVEAEVADWPAADFWHRDAILRALRGDDGWCACTDTFNPKCPEHGGNEHRP